MGDINVLLNTTQTKVLHIKNYITELSKISLKYDTLFVNFAVSECNNATSVRLLIEEEKRALGIIIDFYMDVVEMLERLVESIYEVEDNYSINRIESD